MTGVWLTVVCVAFIAGLLVRAALAEAERQRWRTAMARERARWQSLASGDPEVNLGDDAWLCGALRAVHAELRPGEVTEGLSLRVRWQGTGDQIRIGMQYGDATASRVLLHQRHDDEGCWIEPEEYDLPDGDSPRWASG